MKKIKKLNTTIAIAVYNSEKNLSLLIESLLNQKQINFCIERIIVYSDCSTDYTDNIARTYSSSHKKIKYIAGKKRRGFAGVVKFLFQNNKSDILVILNDDIFINDSKFLSKLIGPFSNLKVGFATGNPNPTPPVNFVQSAANSSFNAFYKMRNSLKNKNNKFTCDGKVMAFSRIFINNLQLPLEKEMGNVDSYLYFSVLSSKYKYKHVKNAKVYYRNPLTVGEYINWITRNNSNRYILKNIFGDIVDKEYKQKSNIWLYKTREIIRYPIQGFFLLVVSIIVKFKSKRYAKNFNPMWSLIISTKNI